MLGNFGILKEILIFDTGYSTIVVRTRKGVFDYEVLHL